MRSSAPHAPMDAAGAPADPYARPLLIILGGMGPMAGVHLHQMVVHHETRAAIDQAHLEVIHVSCADRIPDRSQFLMGCAQVNPGQVAAGVMEPYLDLLESQGRDYRLLIPCATFHAGAILEAFFSASRPSVQTRFLSLIPPAVRAASQSAGDGRIGYLATEGSVAAGVWRDEIQARRHVAVDVPKPLQALVQRAIYDPAQGIKAVSGPSTESVASIDRALRFFCDEGVNSVILGCTDLALVQDELDRAGLALIDPVRELAAEITRLL